MKKRVLSLGLIMALSMFCIAPLLANASAAAPAPATVAQGLQIPINFSSPNGGFNGVFTLTRFIVSNGQVAAVGTLTGTVTNAAGQTVGAIARNITLSLININAT